METRALGQSPLRVSVLGFGCGAVGGLLVRGTPADQERAVARAIELGVTYFDTAPIYGDGRSEENLGRVLRTLGAHVQVGTKVRLAAGDLAGMPAAIARSLDASLARLGLDAVDLFQLHNPIRGAREDSAVATCDVLDAVVPALERLREAGKIRAYGITALGETVALHEVVGRGVVQSAQMVVNLLNPSAAFPVPPGFPAQDFAGLLGAARRAGVGGIVIRVLAAGALAGGDARHPVASPPVPPLGSGADHAADVARAAVFDALVREGHAASAVEASIRLALGADGVATVLVGVSSLAQLEAAAAAVGRGPLAPDALARLKAIWSTLAPAPPR